MHMLALYYDTCYGNKWKPDSQAHRVSKNLHDANSTVTTDFLGAKEYQ